MDAKKPQNYDLFGNPVDLGLSRHETRRQNTSHRYQLIRKKFNELYSKRIDGMRPDMDDVINRVAVETGFAPRTIRDILKKR